MFIYKQSSWHQINGSVHVYFKRFYWSLPIFSLKMNLYFTGHLYMYTKLTSLKVQSRECLLIHAGFTVHWSVPSYKALTRNKPPGALKTEEIITVDLFSNLYTAIFVWYPGNKNNKPRETEWFDCFVEWIQNASGSCHDWLSTRSARKNFMPEGLSRNQSILCFDIVLQHDWPIELCLPILGFSLAGKRRVHVLIFSYIGW